MINVQCTDGQVSVGGEFRAALNAVKDVRGRTYQAETKTWRVPCTTAQFVDIMRGFPCDVQGAQEDVHVTRFGNRHNMADWREQQAENAAASRARAPFIARVETVKDECDAALAAFGFPPRTVAAFRERCYYSIEEAEEQGLLGFSSPVRRDALEALLRPFDTRLEALRREEIETEEAAREAVRDQVATAAWYNK